MASSGRAGAKKGPKRSVWRIPALAGLVVAVLFVPGLAGAGFLVSAAGAAGTASCVPAGSTGLSTTMVVTSDLSNTTVNAAGCDVGIYVPPGTTGITISGVTVTGANDHGIFVQDASSITITGSTVEGNGVAPTAGIDENKAIQLVGTSNSTVTANTVTGNVADGGIGIADDGPIDPGAPNPGTASPSNHDTVSHNVVSGNYKGCGIVLASYNPSGLSADTVTANTVTGSPGQFGPHGPVIGSVVVAADTPGAQVSNVTVTQNTITGAFIPVVVHSNAPGDRVSGVSITGNTIAGNDWGGVDGPPAAAGIIVAASPIPPPATPALTGTTITANRFSGEHFDIWVSGATQTTTSPNSFAVTPGGQPVFTTPPPGSGYWMVGSDGGVFTFGTASYFGSAAGTGLSSPVVGLAPTLDQGGYWLATASGGVVPFGDAGSYGSMAGKPLNMPVVGIAPTPLVPAPPGASSTGPTGKGYWLVAADGGVFNFGDAGFYGSMGATHLAQPVVGMAPTPDGHGYWLVAKDGGVFSFGDAGFYGSMSGKPLSAPVVGIAATPDGKGYWLVAADGGVFSFGDAGFYGSMGATHLAQPVVGMAPTPDGHGYWLVAKDGGVFSFGDAGFYGSMSGKPLSAPVVGAAAVGLTLAG